MLLDEGPQAGLLLLDELPSDVAIFAHSVALRVGCVGDRLGGARASSARARHLCGAARRGVADRPGRPPRLEFKITQSPTPWIRVNLVGLADPQRGLQVQESGERGPK